MIVVETTVWIDLPAARDTPFDRHLTELVESDVPLALVDVVYGEVLLGTRDHDAHDRTRAWLRAFPILRPRGLETFEMAAGLYRTARRRGLTVRRGADCLIAATCLETGAQIYHNDRDFDALAAVSALRIYRPRGVSDDRDRSVGPGRRLDSRARPTGFAPVSTWSPAPRPRRRGGATSR